jgi:hypothetical protein
MTLLLRAESTATTETGPAKGAGPLGILDHGQRKTGEVIHGSGGA